MNKRILELYRLASNDDSVDSEESLIEKFAELIVRKCADLALEFGCDRYTDTQIKDYFGVNE